MKYKIEKVGLKYYVLRRVLFFWWRRITIFDYYGPAEEVWFYTQYQAENYIQEHTK